MMEQQIIDQLQQKGLNDILELIEDAKAGELEELELVESIGLVHDSQLNRNVVAYLQSLGVKIVYVSFDDEEEGEEA